VRSTLIAPFVHRPYRTRRDIVRRPMGGTLSVSGLARLYPMSSTAVQKHVAVSSPFRPISTSSPRRERCSPNFEQLWRDRLGRIGDVLAEPERAFE